MALAWVLAQGEDVIPIPGTKRLRYLEQNARAADLELSGDEMDRLSNLQEAEGERYPKVAASFLNG